MCSRSHGLPRSHNVFKITQYIQGHIAYSRSHSITKVVHVQGHSVSKVTVCSRSHSTTKVTPLCSRSYSNSRSYCVQGCSSRPGLHNVFKVTWCGLGCRVEATSQSAVPSSPRVPQVEAWTGPGWAVASGAPCRDRLLWSPSSAPSWWCSLGTPTTARPNPVDSAPREDSCLGSGWQ